MKTKVCLESVREEFAWFVNEMACSTTETPSETDPIMQMLVNIAASVKPNGIFDSFIAFHDREKVREILKQRMKGSIN